MSWRLTAVAVIGLSLIGCSTDSIGSGNANGGLNSSMEVQLSGNMADIAFPQMMIPHHEQAVVMSEYALVNSQSPKILALAQEIMESQEMEVDQMTNILDRFESGMGGHAGHIMGGMLNEEELALLQAARGIEFDRLFLSGMIAHHEGAIDMADDVLATGADPEVRALAETIVTGQQAEIEYMQELLNN